MRIQTILAKSILTKSKLPDTDYVVNPYTGCSFGCTYCYASFMGRFVNEPIQQWGQYVYVKTNAVELFNNEIQKLMKKNPTASILLSSVTDPYHAPESKYQLTRGILQSLVDVKYPGLVSILTKSPAVLRDVDLLSQLKNVEIGFTLTSTDDALSRIIEKDAPPASRRFKALHELKEYGFKTYAFLGPLLPHFYHNPSLLDDFFKQVAATKVDSIFVEHLNLSTYIKNRLLNELENQPETYQAIYQKNNILEKHPKMDELIYELIKKYGLRLRLNATIYHPEIQKNNFTK